MVAIKPLLTGFFQMYRLCISVIIFSSPIQNISILLQTALNAKENILLMTLTPKHFVIWNSLMRKRRTKSVLGNEFTVHRIVNGRNEISVFRHHRGENRPL
jgi:hypothetical protein